MKYPTGVRVTPDHTITYGNRGMALENELNLTNKYYRDKGTAYIYKKPTPIKITKVSYPSRKEAVIKEAYFEMPSTTDYNGLYKGKYIDFEAKETNSLTAFPLHNIHKHQIEHIENITKNNGICFLIVRFNRKNETYLLMGKDFIRFYHQQERKSIPLSYFKENGYLLKEKYQPRIDYLEIIDHQMEEC